MNKDEQGYCGAGGRRSRGAEGEWMRNKCSQACGIRDLARSGVRGLGKEVFFTIEIQIGTGFVIV